MREIIDMSKRVLSIISSLLPVLCICLLNYQEVHAYPDDRDFIQYAFKYYGHVQHTSMHSGRRQIYLLPRFQIPRNTKIKLAQIPKASNEKRALLLKANLKNKNVFSCVPPELAAVVTFSEDPC